MIEVYIHLSGHAPKEGDFRLLQSYFPETSRSNQKDMFKNLWERDSIPIASI